MGGRPQDWNQADQRTHWTGEDDHAARQGEMLVTLYNSLAWISKRISKSVLIHCETWPSANPRPTACGLPPPHTDPCTSPTHPLHLPYTFPTPPPHTSPCTLSGDCWQGDPCDGQGTL